MPFSDDDYPRGRAFKVLLLDVGLVSAALGLSLDSLRAPEDLLLVNERALAEQLVGQALRTLEPSFKEPELYYWCRSGLGAEAELDYVLQHGTRVIPVEVKAGATGGLKSLHVFMAKQKLPVALRFNAESPSVTEVDVKTTTGDRARYTLLSLPIYLASRLHSWLDQLEERDQEPAPRVPTTARRTLAWLGAPGSAPRTVIKDRPARPRSCRDRVS